MGVDEYITFLVITLLFVLSPGPAVIHAINNGIKYGNRISSWGVFGNVVALMLLVVIGSVGLGALLVASDIFYNLLKMVGAAYLIYLGIKIWFSDSLDSDMGAMSHESKSPWVMFREAFFVTATNPKALAYVTALLPQFLHTGRDITSQLLLLGITIAVVQFTVLMSYVWFSNRVRHWLMRATVRRVFNRVTGSVFVGFGVMLGVSSNKG